MTESPAVIFCCPVGSEFEGSAQDELAGETMRKLWRHRAAIALQAASLLILRTLSWKVPILSDHSRAIAEEGVDVDTRLVQTDVYRSPR